MYPVSVFMYLRRVLKNEGVLQKVARFCAQSREDPFCSYTYTIRVWRSVLVESNTVL